MKLNNAAVAIGLRESKNNLLAILELWERRKGDVEMKHMDLT